MRIAKLKVPQELTRGKGLKEINLDKKPLGSTVALVGKNGAGKSRVLHFVETFIDNITIEAILEKNLIDFPFELQQKANFETSLKNANETYRKFQSTRIQAEKQSLANSLGNNAVPVMQMIKQVLPNYVKLVNNDDLNSIKQTITNNLTFKQILDNQHSVVTNNNVKTNTFNTKYNEFSIFNSNATIAYITELANENLRVEFNLYRQNKKNHEAIEKEMMQKSSYQLFEKFHKNVSRFLGKEFSYEQLNSGNTINSQLLFNNKQFNINLLSPGQKTLFAYAILFFYLEVNSKANISESIIIIDEPEKGLHPEAQVALINALKEIITTGQLWIATHSVHILSHLEYDEIIMVKDDEIISPSRTTPGNSFIQLMGLDGHISELSTFINSISEWAYGNFMVQCFKEPDVVFAIDKEDPQFLLFKEFIDTKTNIDLLDFGAGKGRIGYSINEDEIISKKINYYAYEPNKEYSNYLEGLNGIRKIYYNESELSENTFDCIILCNVLHEITPENWMIVLLTIKKSLKEDGYLLFIEDKFLPKGEKANKYGYLIFGTEEMKVLLNTDTVLELKSDNIQHKDRLVFNAFQKKQINPSNESVKASIQLLKENVFARLKELRVDTSDNVAKGRRYANEAQLYINSELALESLK